MTIREHSATLFTDIWMLSESDAIKNTIIQFYSEK